MRNILAACLLVIPSLALAEQKNNSETKDVTVKDLKDKDYDCGVTGGGYVCTGDGDVWVCEGSGNSDVCEKIRTQLPKLSNPARQMQPAPKAVIP